ncbi:MAG: hypothetical protein JWQ94_553 [Tardiphaga sp.]|nr:hypothetical protein [Tardiphaga sp.]
MDSEQSAPAAAQAGHRTGRLAEAGSDTVACSSNAERRTEDGLAQASADAQTPAEPRVAEEIVHPDGVMFDLIAAALYHRSRMAWFVTLQRVSLFATLLASTSAVAAIVRTSPTVAIAVSMSAAAISAAGLAFDFSGGARKHDECRRVYHDIAATLTEDLACETQCRAKVIRAAASEPPVFEAANAVAYNAAIRSLGLDESERFVLTKWQSLLRHVWHYTGTRFPKANELTD